MLAVWTRIQSAYMALRDERGASLVEYALLVALIAVVCIAAVTLLGSAAEDKFSSIASAIDS